MIIRLEYYDDILEIRAVNRAAFPGGKEAAIVDRLRTSDAKILSLVAIEDRKLIGHILFTVAKAGNIPMAALAPVAVHPAYQGRGAGSALVRQGLADVKAMGYPAAIVLGHPEYYHRFGFESASRWNIRCEYVGVPDEAFMAVVWDKTLFGKECTARFHPEFRAAL